MELNIDAPACPDTSCRSEIRIGKPRQNSGTEFSAVCAGCGKIYTAEITPLIKMREGGGPFEDVDPPEEIHL